MGTSYLIDSNAIIDLMDSTLPATGAQWLLNIVNSNEYALSVINQMEVLSTSAKPATAAVIEKFIGNSFIISLDDDIIDQTIAIRRLIRIKLPDAIVAATALVFDLTLITRNLADFQKVPGLKVLNPHTV